MTELSMDRIYGWRALVHRVGVIWRLEAAQMVRPVSLLWASGLALLPTLLLSAVRAVDTINPNTEIVAYPGVVESMMYTLIPGVVCFLGLLLTATSAVQSELENRTWIYIAVRPGARLAALLGKYLFAVSWVFTIATISALAVTLTMGELASVSTLARIVGLSLLSCLAYGAIYLFIGVAFLRIGMVVAIAYTILVELVLGSVPAIVNDVTVQYHLRSLFVRGLPEGMMPPEVLAAMGDTVGSGLGHILIILGMVPLFLGASVLVIRLRQAAATDPD